MRELQPIEDKIDSTALEDEDYNDLVKTWATLIASAHMRSGGWKGSATLDALIKYGQALTLPHQKRLLQAAERAANRQKLQFREFKKIRTA